MTQVYQEYAVGVFGLLGHGFAIKADGGSYRFEGYKKPWQLECAVQEVFVRAFSQRARLSYDGLRPYKNYLFTIARNYVVDLFRKGERELLPIDEESTPASESGSGLKELDGSPEEVASHKQLLDQVEAFLEALDSQERRLFDVRFRDGLSVEASAAKLGTSEYKVKRGEKTLRKRFFHWMKKHGYFEGYEYSEKRVHELVLLYLVAKVLLESC